MTIPVTDAALDLEKTAMARCARRSPFRSWPAWVYFGVFMVSFGVFYILWCTNSLQNFVQSQLQLRNGTDALSLWKDPPIKMHFEIYVFNYTNVDDYLAYRTNKLHVEELGPYIYLETKKRINVVSEGDILSYQEKKSYKWIGGRSEDDIIVMPNVPLLSTSAFAKNLNFAGQLGVTAVLTSFKMKPFIHVKAGEFFWGYDDAFFETVKPFLRLKQKVPFEKFGIFALKNGVDTDRLSINTGTKDINKLGILEQFNGRSNRYVWDDEQCNKLEGTDGTIFPPYLLNNTSNALPVYSKEMCMSIPFLFSEQVTVSSIPAIRYKPSPDVFTFTIKKGKCYCQKNEKGNTICPPKGVFDISTCIDDIPVVMSFPHFLWADESLLKQIDGLHPRQEDHISYIDVNTRILAPIAAWSKLQVNVQVKKALGVPLLGRLENNMIVPLVWMNAGVNYNDMPQYVQNLIYQINVTLRIVEVILQWSSLVGMIISMGALLVCFKKHRMEHPDVGLQMDLVDQNKFEVA